MVTCEIKLLLNNCEIISAFYFTCNHRRSLHAKTAKQNAEIISKLFQNNFVSHVTTVFDIEETYSYFAVYYEQITKNASAYSTYLTTRKGRNRNTQYYEYFRQAQQRAVTNVRWHCLGGASVLHMVHMNDICNTGMPPVANIQIIYGALVVTFAMLRRLINCRIIIFNMPYIITEIQNECHYTAILSRINPKM